MYTVKKIAVYAAEYEVSGLQIMMIGENCACVYIVAEEIRDRGISHGNISEKEARKLLKAAGLPDTWNNVDVEIYPGKEELLLFVRCDSPWRWYSFSDLEMLLGAAALIEATEESALYYFENAYILGLNGNGRFVAEEFGASIPAGKGYEAFLGEHGKVLLKENAVYFLRQTFRETTCKAAEM